MSRKFYKNFVFLQDRRIKSNFLWDKELGNAPGGHYCLPLNISKRSRYSNGKENALPPFPGAKLHRYDKGQMAIAIWPAQGIGVEIPEAPKGLRNWNG
jgi:hypothetical protein